MYDTIGREELPWPLIDIFGDSIRPKSLHYIKFWLFNSSNKVMMHLRGLGFLSINMPSSVGSCIIAIEDKVQLVAIEGNREEFTQVGRYQCSLLRSSSVGTRRSLIC